jgi:subtilisin family serine protease
MARFLQSLLLSLALWLMATATAPAATTAEAPPAQRQVLVLLRLPPEHFRPNADYADGYGDRQGLAARRRIASRIAHDHNLVLVTSWPMPVLGVDCYVMTVPDSRSPEDVVAALSHDHDVEWSEPMGVYHAQGASTDAAPDETQRAPMTYNDPLYPVQPAARQWRLADLHEISTGKNVRVAVIDSMVEASHPDLVGQVQVVQNFVEDHPAASEAHGTGVAGVIAAVPNNRLGVVGIAPNARLMALRACWQPLESRTATECNTLSLAKALEYAVTHGAQVINLSLSGPDDPLLGKLIDAALARNMTVVGAYDPKLKGGGFPASHRGVIAVTDESSGPPPPGAYAAPGRDIPTTEPGGRWYIVNGSSYAAAHVSGLFALLRERGAHGRGGLVLVSTGASEGGRINACATLLKTSGPCQCGCAHQYPAIAQR